MPRSARRPRLLVAGILTATALIAAALAGSPAVSAAEDEATGSLLAKPMPAQRALTKLSASETALVAARNDWSVRQLVDESSDGTLWIDRDGRLFYVEDTVPRRHRAPVGPAAGPYPYSQTFLLHSKPGSQRTIYLDFTGHTVTGTAWNALTATDPQSYGPYDSDGNPGAFSNAEKDQIQLTFQKMAEDFAPFDVDVTTQEPDPSVITRTDLADQVYGTRLLITPGGDVYTIYCGSGCGGVAYVDVFDEVEPSHSYYQPAFVFTNGVGTGAKNITEAGSHEVGHNLGLNHDGTPSLGYYAGHGVWAPIMGVGYYEPVSQWSKGEYTNANNTEDDLAVMASNGVASRADDHGNTGGSGTLVGPGTTNTPGVITSGDRDWFRFRQASSGRVTLTATPAPSGPNLDIQMRLTRADGTVLFTANPAVTEVNAEVATGMDAARSKVLGPGNYRVRILGTSYLDPSTGYSSYGNLGAYTLRVALP